MSEEKFKSLLNEKEENYDLEKIINGNSLYEYQVVTISDNSDGSTDVENLKRTLIKYSV